MELDGGVVLAIDTKQVTSAVNRSQPDEVAPTLHKAGTVVSFKPSHYTRGKDGAPSDVWLPLSADADKGDQEALAFNVKQDGSDSGIVAPTLLAMPHDTSHANGGGQLGVLAFHHTQDPIHGSVAPALGGTTDWMAIVTPTLSMGAHTAAPGSNGQDAAQWAEITHQHTGRPRRLTPLECERLMGWSDGWTATGTREDGATYALSDSARYRLCGNGVGAPVAEWIGRQLVAHDAALRQEDAA